jgi:hypothetical protein
MSSWRNVVRYHLVVPWLSLTIPWGILAISFAVNLVIFAFAPQGGHSHALTGPALGAAAQPNYTGGVASIYILFLAIGVSSIGRSLPFGLALGVSRRSYYTGTALFGAAMAATDAVGLAALQAIERATDGWGVRMHFFQVPFILSGPWYLTALTSFVALALLFVYGMWFGIVYRRWSLYGVLGFVAAQLIAVLAATLIVAGADAWSGVDHFFSGLTAAGLTGLLAAMAALLLAGGQATIRRATV